MVTISPSPIAIILLIMNYFLSIFYLRSIPSWKHESQMYIDDGIIKIPCDLNNERVPSSKKTDESVKILLSLYNLL